MNLSIVEFNKPLIVKKINLEGKILKKLNDFGVIEGSNITLIKKAPFNGAMAVFSKGFVFIIRQKDARKIEVEYEL